MTIRPPARYRPTLSGDSFSAARPIDLMPPMITSQVSTAMTMPETSRGMPNDAVEHQRHRVRLRERRRRQRRDCRRRTRRSRRAPASAAVAQVVHRARQHGVAARLAKRHAEHRLGELDRRRDEAVDPDPEQRARPARDDRRGHAGDVAGADRRAERRHERLKRRQRARRPRCRAERTPRGRHHRTAAPARTGADRQEEARAEQNDDDPRHEQRVGRGLNQLNDDVHFVTVAVRSGSRAR